MKKIPGIPFKLGYKVKFHYRSRWIKGEIRRIEPYGLIYVVDKTGRTWGVSAADLKKETS